MNNLLITEKDIFTYSRRPDLLEEAKINFIRTHEKKFSAQIDFCKESDNIFDSADQNKLLGRIFEKLPLHKTTGVLLYPVFSPGQTSNESLKLAADSPAAVDLIKTFTFTDNKSQYLVKLVRLNTGPVVIFYAEDETRFPLKITLYPQQETYFVEKNNHPVEIKDFDSVENICVEDINLL